METLTILWLLVGLLAFLVGTCLFAAIRGEGRDSDLSRRISEIELALSHHGLNKWVETWPDRKPNFAQSLTYRIDQIKERLSERNQAFYVEIEDINLAIGHYRHDTCKAGQRIDAIIEHLGVKEVSVPAQPDKIKLVTRKRGKKQ